MLGFPNQEILAHWDTKQGANEREIESAGDKRNIAINRARDREKRV